MTPSPDYAQLSAKAEAAVEGVTDPELRRIAYRAVLERLIAEAAQNAAGASQPLPSEIRSALPADQPSTPRNKIGQRHPFPVSIFSGLLAAILAATPRIGDYFSLLGSAARGGASLAALRGYENDLAFHFLTNWLIWSIVTGILIRYIPVTYRIFVTLDVLGLIAGILIGFGIAFTKGSYAPATMTPRPVLRSDLTAAAMLAPLCDCGDAAYLDIQSAPAGRNYCVSGQIADSWETSGAIALPGGTMVHFAERIGLPGYYPGRTVVVFVSISQDSSGALSLFVPVVGGINLCSP